MSSSSSSPSPAVLPVTTRSRTLLFFSYRDSATRPRRPRSRTLPRYDLDDDDDLHESDERQGLIRGTVGAASPSPGSGHVTLDVQELPPKWVDISDQVEDILANVQSKISALDKLHAKHVLPGFTDRSAEEREIEAAASDITRDFRQCHSLIQRIAPTPTSRHTFPPKQPSQHEMRAAQNVQRALAAKVQELSGTFRKKQRVYMERLQGHAIKNQDVLVASGVVRLRGSEGIFALEEDVRATSSFDPSQSQSQSQSLLQTDDLDVRQRTHEVTEIAKSIGQLAELFKDLSTMVIDQGTILDSVEWNVQQTAVEVEEAVKELKVAQTYQRSTGRRQCIFLLIIVIIGLILLLIFKPKRHGGGGGNGDGSSSATSSPSLTPTAMLFMRKKGVELRPPYWEEWG